MLPMQTKASLIACLVGLGAMSGFPGGGCTLRLTTSLGTAVAKGHFVDPTLNAANRSLRQLRRMVEQRQEAFSELERVQHCYAKGEAVCDGPVAVIHRILRRMGWHWQAPSRFAWEGRPSLGLLDGLESWWLHQIRQGMRLAEWNRAGNRRRDMRSIGIHSRHRQDSHIKAVSSTKIPSEHQINLGEASLRLRLDKKRQFDGHRAHTPMCLFGGEEPEDEDHMLWRCPQWEAFRQ